MTSNAGRAGAAHENCLAHRLAPSFANRLTVESRLRPVVALVE